MSRYENVLETSEDGRFRVLLELEEGPDEPYDDGQCPLLRIEPRTYRTDHVMATGRPTGDDDTVEAAVRHWQTTPSDDDWRLFEKYLRAFFGTTHIVTWYSDSYWYVAYDTTAWRGYCGWDDGHPMPADAVNLNEYRAWCEGEVYCYAVERNVTWHRDDDPDATMSTCETEDSCGGYYGLDWAKECAMEAYRDAIAKASSDDAARIAAAVADIQRVDAASCRDPACTIAYPHYKHDRGEPGMRS